MTLMVRYLIGVLVLWLCSACAVAYDFVLVPAWQSQAVFEAPESVVFDPQKHCLYVSNVNGKPNEKDGNGYISKVALDGTLIQRHWITGLHAPKGMTIVHDRLYVADINQLVVIDLKQNKIVQRYTAPQAQFLNDVTADSHGNVYVSGFLTDSIYRLQQQHFSLWLKSDKLASPNGLLVKDNQLIIASWGRMTNGFATKIPGHLLTVDLSSKAIKDLGHTPIGNLDGLEPDVLGHYLVTDWMAGRLYLIDSTGQSQTLLALHQGSADLTVLPAQHRVIIPMMMDGKILAFDMTTP